MATWEFSIACRDEIELHRKKEGDIISCKPYPSKSWGRKPSKNCLIVIISGLSKRQAHRLCSHQYASGKYEDEQGIDESGILIRKYRHKIPLEVIKYDWGQGLLDLDRVKNPGVKYQPLLEQKIIFNIEEPKALIYDKHTNDYNYPREVIVIG